MHLVETIAYEVLREVGERSDLRATQIGGEHRRGTFGFEGKPRDRLNVNGGACALGRPIGATGARLIVTLLHAMRQRCARHGVAALCIGGGEATAIAIEIPGAGE